MKYNTIDFLLQLECFLKIMQEKSDLKVNTDRMYLSSELAETPQDYLTKYNATI